MIDDGATTGNYIQEQRLIVMVGDFFKVSIGE